MIFRIQNLYLLLGFVALVVAMFLPWGGIWTQDLQEADMLKPWGIYFSDGGFQSTWALLLMLVISSVLELITIFFFLDHMRQIRLIVFSSVVLVGFYLTAAVFGFYITSKIDGGSFRPALALSLEFVTLVLNYLAVRSILKDESLQRIARKLR